MGSEKSVGSETVFVRSESDMACGPRCLWALMQLTGVGKAESEIDDIYEVIERPVLTPVNLKDLRDAALKLGFKASGQKLSISKLKAMKGYVILPIGKTAATKDNPQHFVLIAGALEDHLFVVDSRSLAVRAIPLEKLKEVWGGIALVIPTDALGNLLFRPSVNVQNSDIAGNRQRINLGAVEVGSKIDRQIVVPEKDNKDVWKIIGKSCHCLEAELSRYEEGRTILSLQLEVKRGGPQSSYVALFSKSSKARKDYHLLAYGKNTHSINPKIGYLEVEKGQAEYPVTIEYFPGELKTAVTFDGLETDIPNLTCGDVKVEEVAYGNMKAFRFTIPLTYTVTNANLAKTFKETVSFKLNTPTGRLFIPFEFSVKAGRLPLELTPSNLFMMCSKSATKPIEKKIRVTVSTEEPYSELSIKPVISMPIHTSRRQVSKQEYILSISVMPSDLREVSVGIQKGEIAIILRREGKPDQSDTLPVCIVVRD